MNKLRRFAQLSCWILLLIAQVVYADPPLPTPVGRVVWVKGNLKATMENKEARLLQKTSVIYLHDTLSTDETSQAQIVFTDNTLMTFRESTQFYIDKYVFNPQVKKGSVGTYVMNLIEGGFRTITGLIGKSNPADYQVKTPVATIGVRGTDFSAAFTNGQAFVNTLQGAVTLTNGAGSIVVGVGDSASAKRYDVPPKRELQVPFILQKQLPIEPAKIAQFQSSAPATGPAAPAPGSGGGTVSSFCIQ